MRWRERARLLRRGFLPVSRVLYELDRNDACEYVSDRQRLDAKAINGAAGQLLDDKVAFAFTLERFGVRVPRLEALVVNGEIRPTAMTEDAEAWLRDLLAARRRLVIKPIRGGGGSGVLMLLEEGGRVRLNSRSLSWNDFMACVRRLRDHVIVEHIQQGAYAEAVNPLSTNTLRILTLVPPGQTPIIAGAVHRFGTAASLPVDNWTQGGLCAVIDPSTGRLGPGAAFPRTGHLAWATHHPDTGAAIAGLVIPLWKAIRERVVDLAHRLRFLPYVGWDIVVTDDGFAILEGNRNSDVNLLQIHGPLLRDPAVRAFYRRYGVVE
jgi:putative polysaccharide biosynthesis protein